MLRREPKGAPRSASKAGLDRRIAWLMETAGVIGLAAAAGLWWAGDDRGRATMVVVAMVVLVNAMVVAVLYSIFTARRKARNRPRARRSPTRYASTPTCPPPRSAGRTTSGAA